MKKMLLWLGVGLLTTHSVFSGGATSAGEISVEKVVSVWRDWGQIRDTEMADKIHQIIQERTGIDLEQVLVPIDQIETKTTLMIAAGEQLDFGYLYGPDQSLPLYRKGLVLELTDLVTENMPNMLRYYPATSDQYRTASYKDELYAVPFGDVTKVWFGIYIRTDWLREANLAMPKTIAQFDVALDAFYNGRGTPRYAPLSAGHTPLQDLTEIVADFYLPSGREWWLNSAGQLTPPEAHPNYKLLLAKVADWYSKGYLPQDIFVSTIEQRREAVAQDHVGAYVGQHTSLQTSGAELLRRDVTEADFTLIPSLRGADDAANAWRRNNTDVHTTVIFKTSKVPDRILQYFDMHFVYKDGYELLGYGIEGESFVRDGGDYNFIGALEPKDWKSAPYYFGWNLFVSGSPALNEHREEYPYEEDNYMSWWAQREGRISMNVRTHDPADVKVIYDTTEFRSESRLADLQTFFDEQKILIITGQSSADNWNSIYAQWLTLGGEDLIDDKNAQYNAYVSE